MTLRQDMIQALARAPQLLDTSIDLVRKYVISRMGEEGGFTGRGSKSDLYYTVFGIELLISLGCPVPVEPLKKYLASFDGGTGLDLVHLASLTRCHASLAEFSSADIEPLLREKLAENLFSMQCMDGAYSSNEPGISGNAYGCFLAVAMCQDLGIPVQNREAVLECLDILAMENGGYSNEAAAKTASTPSTAAVLCSFHMLDCPVPEKSVEWLIDQIHSHGGFCALAGPGPLCIPDLLSTATALQALSYCHSNVSVHRERHLDFLDSLWNPSGGFSGSWADPEVDCEYTYYGLLSLGYLADNP